MTTNKQISFTDTNTDFSIEHLSSVSSNSDIEKEINITYYDILNNWGKQFLSKEFFFQDSSVFLNVDLSSVWPRFEIITETYQKEAVKEEIPEEMLEYDIVFHIPPQRSYKIKMNVKSIKKGELKFVEPEGIL